MTSWRHRVGTRLRRVGTRLRRVGDARPPDRWLAALAFALAVAVNLAFWAFLPAPYRVNESTDYRDGYEPVARHLVAGQGLVDLQGRPAVRYPPGFPLFLAGVFATAEATGLPEGPLLSAALLACLGASAVFVFLLARRFARPWPAWIATALWITYPPALWLAKQPNSEIPFLVPFFAALWLLLTGALDRPAGWRFAVAFFGAGLLAGLAMLVRPIAVGLGVVLAAVVLLTPAAGSRRWLAVALVLAGNLVAIAPWQVFVHVETGRHVLLGTGSRYAIRDGLTFAVRHQDTREGVDVPEDVRRLMLELQERYGDLRTLGGVADALAQQWRERPLAVVQLFALKAARSWYGTDSQRFEGILLALQLVYGLLATAALVVAWRSRSPAARFAVVTALAVVGYFWAMNVVAASLLRYQVPSAALLLALTASFWGTRPAETTPQRPSARSTARRQPA